MITFLCGCTSHMEIPFPDPSLLATFDGISVDGEGFIQCAIHRQRRYGWRSLPTLPGLNFNRWEFSSCTPLEIEEFVVFGQLPRFKKCEFVSRESEDRRDNRDPQTLVVSCHNIRRGDRVLTRSRDDDPFYIVPRGFGYDCENLLSPLEETRGADC